jgi:hypothetical protein
MECNYAKNRLVFRSGSNLQGGERHLQIEFEKSVFLQILIKRFGN